MSAAGNAHRLLRLLLAEGTAPAPWSEDRWRDVLPVARAGGVLLRTVARHDASALPAQVVVAADAERARFRATLTLMHRVARACDARGVPHLFVSGLQHLPDSGDDVDLLVPAGVPGLAEAIAAAIGTSPRARSVRARLAGTVRYGAEACTLPVDVHLGRLGIAGEHVRFPADLLSAATARSPAAPALRVPNAEDQMVLQGMHRLYGRRLVRLGDIVSTVASVRNGALDWELVFARAQRSGTAAGLARYLGVLEALHRTVLDRPLLPPPVLAWLEPSAAHAVSLRGGAVRFPVLRVNARLIPSAVAGRLRDGDWPAALRVSLVPFVLAWSSARRRMRMRRRGSVPVGAPA